jgi:hypothetical protein
MPEPTSSGVGAAAYAAGAITISGSFLGLQYDFLLAGMFGGLIALSFAVPATRLRMAVSVATSAIVAAYATPVLAVVATEYFPSAAKAGDSPLRMFCACALGIGAQTIVPVGLAWIRKRLGAQT